MNDDFRTSQGDVDLSLAAFWMEMWMMPITMGAQMMGLSRGVLNDTPEIDRECKDCQLPVPNSHQKDMDHDLFA